MPKDGYHHEIVDYKRQAHHGDRHFILLIAGFLAGAQIGYDLGYLDGENRANGWWIDKKTHYYESSEIRKKRFNLKHNHI